MQFTPYNPKSSGPRAGDEWESPSSNKEKLRSRGRGYMGFTIKPLPKSEVKLTVEIDRERMKEFFDKAVEELVKNLELKGFRKGHIPKEIAERKLNSSHVLEKAAEIAVKKTYPEIILARKIEAIGPPRIKVLKISQGDSFIYETQVAVLPKIELKDYKNVDAIRRGVKVEEVEVEKALNWLQKSRAKYIKISRPAKFGDEITIDFNSYLAGVPLEDGQGENHSFILGEGRFVPGFEENLEGVREGETKNFSILFPENYYKKNLAAKLVDFKVKMNLAQEVQIPQINDSFAQSLGNFPNLISLKKSIKDGLFQEKEIRETQRLRSEILEKITEKVKIELPEILIEKELDKMLEEIRGAIEAAGLKFEDYLSHLKKSVQDLREGWQKTAQERVKTALVLREIANKENIEVSDKEIEEKRNKEVSSRYSSKEAAQKEIDLDEFKEYIRGVIRNEKTLELLERFAKKE